MWPSTIDKRNWDKTRTPLINTNGFMLNVETIGIIGNNIYGNDIQAVLKTLTEEQRNAYILMDIIRPPITKNVFLRNGEIVRANVVSELGFFGIYLHDGEKVLRNEDGGYLLRTKDVDSNEGGVSSGFAALDSLTFI